MTPLLVVYVVVCGKGKERRTTLVASGCQMSRGPLLRFYGTAVGPGLTDAPCRLTTFMKFEIGIR